MTNDADFRTEQATLGGLWTFLGFDSDIPARDDWFRTMLGGRSIFVQRFAAGLRAYENRCAHRFFPLRQADSGNGPVVCGFHGWRYNAEGAAQGIPKCVELFGKTPQEIDARLPAVELACCGPMIFGRFPGGPDVSLRDWLGDGFTILSRVVVPPPARERYTHVTRSHWKLLFDISLDDYHSVTVHPWVWGWSGKYLSRADMRYFRFGSHSAYFSGSSDTAFADMTRACAAGPVTVTGYRIFQFFPNLVVLLTRVRSVVGEEFSYLMVQTVVPERPDRTRSVSWFVPLIEAGPLGFWRSFLRNCTLPWGNLAFRYFMRRVNSEDSAACEARQSVIHQVNGEPALGALETRIGWLEEEYARYVKLPSAAPEAGST